MKLTPPEWEIMNVLWERHPATARDVFEHLPEGVDWAYTTIKTMLTRLVAKGVLHERKRANTSVYEPLISRQKARRSALHNLVNQAFGGAMAPLMHFMVEDEDLTAKQREELIEALRQERKEKGGKP